MITTNGTGRVFAQGINWGVKVRIVGYGSEGQIIVETMSGRRAYGSMNR